jgi:hypothetical protein
MPNSIFTKGSYHCAPVGNVNPFEFNNALGLGCPTKLVSIRNNRNWNRN